MEDQRRILNSWKEIAGHLGRGIRTVQRWERDLGLPVHRPDRKRRSAVLAPSGDLESWLRQTTQTSPPANPPLKLPRFAGL